MGSVDGRAAQTLLLHRGAVTVKMRHDTATVIANPDSFTGAPLALRAEQAWLQVGKEAAKYIALFLYAYMLLCLLVVAGSYTVITS